MSVRRRRIRDRIRAEAKLAEGRSVFEICLQQIQIAVTRARARGETRCTEQFLIEAFHEESPSLETGAIAPSLVVAARKKCEHCGLYDWHAEGCPTQESEPLSCAFCGSELRKAPGLPRECCEEGKRFDSAALNR
jgi:hypothetical protein